MSDLTPISFDVGLCKTIHDERQALLFHVRVNEDGTSEARIAYLDDLDRIEKYVPTTEIVMIGE